LVYHFSQLWRNQQTQQHLTPLPPKVAIKTIKYKNVKTDIEKKHIEREKAILALLRHPNIVQLHKVVEDEERNCCYMIMEYVPGGELFDYIVTHGRIKEKDARKFIRQVRPPGLFFCPRKETFLSPPLRSPDQAANYHLLPFV